MNLGGIMHNILKQLSNYGIIPVVVLNDLKNTILLAQSLCSGGLPCAEITFRTADAEEAIHIMSTAFPNMLVGAGTILTMNQVDAAIMAGAKFIVTPGFDPEIVDYCLEKNILIIPGCITPSEVAQAVKRGLDVIKFFPAEQAGGISMIKALSAPYKDIKFIPTGGIDIDNLSSYLSYNSIIACGGSWMVKNDIIEKGDFDLITKLTKEAVTLTKQIQAI